MYQEVELLEVVDVHVTEFSAEHIKAEVALKVNNPNWYKVRLVDSEIDLEINGSNMGVMNLSDKLVIDAKSISYPTLKIDADLSNAEGNFLQNFLTLIFNPKIHFKAEGYAKAKGLIFTKKVPILIEEDIDPQNLDMGK